MNTTFSTRTEAIDAIITAIEATGETTRDEFDIDAIADEVIEGEGFEYSITSDTETFWASVMNHAIEA